MWEIIIDKDDRNPANIFEDHYEEVEYIEPCMICKNRSTEKCDRCCRN